MNETCAYHDEVFVAQCLVSMSKEQRAQCNGPSPVSSDEEYLTKEEGYRFKSRYGIEGMIPASALPDPNHWEREKNSRER